MIASIDNYAEIGMFYDQAIAAKAKRSPAKID